MKALKMATLGVVVAVAMALTAVAVTPAKAQNSLNDLLVTNGLFGGYSAQSLAGLIAVDNTTGGGTIGGAGNTNLNDLIILNGLFGTGSWGWNNSAQDLAGLIAVNNLYNGGF